MDKSNMECEGFVKLTSQVDQTEPQKNNPSSMRQFQSGILNSLRNEKIHEIEVSKNFTNHDLRHLRTVLEIFDEVQNIKYLKANMNEVNRNIKRHIKALESYEEMQSYMNQRKCTQGFLCNEEPPKKIKKLNDDGFDMNRPRIKFGSMLGEEKVNKFIEPFLMATFSHTFPVKKTIQY